MMLTYTGFLKVKGGTKQVSDKFRIREFVLTDDAPSYPQTIQFQLTQDRCSIIDNVKLGDNLMVHFSLKGREWKNPQGEIKYFNSLDVFKIEKITKSSVSSEEEPAQPRKAKKKETEETFTQETSFSNETLVPTPDDDLPF